MRLLLTLLILASATPAFAQQPGDAAQILARVDRVATQASDFTARVELVTVDAKGKSTERTFTVWQKGRERRMLKLTSPARLEGVGMLATGHDALWMYLPSFGKARRVAGRKRGEPFLGSNFTQDDMVRTAYEPRFTPTLVAQDDSSWTLRLEPKKPAAEPYHHLVVVVSKTDAVVTRIDFYEDEARATRRLEATDIRDVGQSRVAHHITVTDLADKSRSTVVLHDVKTDAGLEDDFFSERQLKRKP